MKIVNFILVFALLVFCLGLVLVAGKIIWTSPAYYAPSAPYRIETPILSNDAYSALGDHPRPFIYGLSGNSGGKVVVLGLDHTKDTDSPQLDSVLYYFEKNQPTVVLVEGRLGFLFRWFQDPTQRYGEQGFTADMAIKRNAELFTWEPAKDEQIKLMAKSFDAERVALFYALRPYFSNFRFGKPANPEEKMNEYIKSRTNHPLLKGLIKDWQEVDVIWKRDFPFEKDWRDYSDEWGWPEGYLSAMSDYNNSLRDIHLCNAIIDLVNQGETVLATMGSSHAVKIKSALTDFFESTRTE